MTGESRSLKSLVVRALGGPESSTTAFVRSALGRGPNPFLRFRAEPPSSRQPRVGDAVETSEPPPEASPEKIERQRIEAAAAHEFSHGRLPTNFSINLGVAPCNHSCLFCPQSVVKPKKAAWLDLKLLRKVLNEMPEENVHLNISSYSETLAAPNLVSAVRLMKEIRPKLPISMATNGSLFRQKVIEGILEAGLDYYQYSLDAPTKESYHRLIQRDDFDTILANLDRIVEMRNRINPDTIVTTHLMEFKETTAQNQVTMEDLRSRLGKQDMISERRVANWGGGPWNLEKNLAQAGFTPVYKAPEKRFPCTSIFMHFKLSPHGTYYPCVAAVPDSLEKDELHNVPSLGLARNTTWLQAWRKLSDMRRAHLEGRWDDHDCCRKCNIWGLWKDYWDDHGETTADRPRFTIKGAAEHVDDGRGLSTV